MTIKHMMSWLVIILNPILIFAMVPIPLVQYGKISWGLVIAGLIIYTAIWLVIWKVKYQMGATLELETK